MKKIFLLSSILLSLNSFAFYAQVNCEIQYGATAACTVYNQFPRPIYCQLNGNGQTQSGAYVNLYGNGWVAPYDSANLFIKANNPYIDPLVFVNANANCTF